MAGFGKPQRGGESNASARSGWDKKDLFFDEERLGRVFFANLASQAGICDVSIYAKYDGQIHLTIYSKAHGTYKVKGEKTKYS